MQTILFLCTGNYYRSRFSEHLFNWMVLDQGIAWRGVSRGLALERGTNNVGAISTYAAEALTDRGIVISEHERLPQQAQDEDFRTADRIIALDELEHRPLIEERFPSWTQRVEYWLVHDIDQTSAEIALQTIANNLSQLIESLAHAS
jgi:protein-tyrosine phosphatase